MRKSTLWLAASLVVAFGATAQTNVKSNWVGGDLVFEASDGTDIMVITDDPDIEIPSGSVLDIESGGALELAGTAVTSTAAELNLLDTVTATTAQIEKLANDGLIVCDAITVDCGAGGTTQTANLTLIPATSILLEVLAVVDEAFDGDSTTTFEVGITGNTDNYIDPSDFDPSGAVNSYQAMLLSTNADNKSTEWLAAATQLIGTWTNDASASAGIVTVYVIYVDL